jgi:RNA polymerase sigma-70 factor (ECF subfamily)
MRALSERARVGRVTDLRSQSTNVRNDASPTEDPRNQGPEDAVVAAATAGDPSAFAQLFVRYRRELVAHSYRILGSHEDAEDLTQETFLRSWDKRETFQGRSSYRAWLYRIATNACLTALARQHGRQRSPNPEGIDTHRLLEAMATPDASPAAVVVSNETVELALLVAVEHMPPRQRTVLVLRDLVGWSAKDAAALLESTVASVNSALQRARATLRSQLSNPRTEWARASDPGELKRALPGHYLDVAA